MKLERQLASWIDAAFAISCPLHEQMNYDQASQLTSQTRPDFLDVFCHGTYLVCVADLSISPNSNLIHIFNSGSINSVTRPSSTITANAPSSDHTLNYFAERDSTQN